jgi:hypothetical protein
MELTKALIPSAHHLIERLDRESGMYLTPDIRDTAPLTVGGKLQPC